LLRLIDRQYTARPFFGVRRMTAMLRRDGHAVNDKRVRRLMRVMDWFSRYVLKEAGVRISMDGVRRAYDHMFVERLWRSLKYEEVYLRDYGMSAISVGVCFLVPATGLSAQSRRFIHAHTFRTTRSGSGFPAWVNAASRVRQPRHAQHGSLVSSEQLHVRSKGAPTW
jgi:transposase InsO family protein